MRRTRYKRMLRNKRTKDRRRLLLAVYLREKRLCHWCGELTILVGAVPNSRRVKWKQDQTMMFKDINNELCELPIATLDHLESIWEEAHMGNVVLSCAKCNSERGKNEL